MEQEKERAAWFKFAEAQFAYGIATAELRRSEHPAVMKKATDARAMLVEKARALVAFGVDMSEVLGDN